MEYLGIFSLGLLIGAGLVRYGIGLGTRIVERAKEGLPAFGKEEEPIEQNHTGDQDYEEEE